MLVYATEGGRVRSDPPGLVDLTMPKGIPYVYGVSAYGENLYLLGSPYCVTTSGICEGASIWKYNLRTKLLATVVPKLDLFTHYPANPALTVSDRFIFWIEWNKESEQCVISRADLDGFNVKHGFVTGVSCRGGLSSHTSQLSRPSYTYLYYADRTGQNIMSAGSSGQESSTRGRVEVAGVSVNGIRGIAVNSNSLFWINSGTFSSSIGKTSRDGRLGRGVTAAEADFIKGASTWAQGLAAEEDRVYWGNDGLFNPTIGAATPDGKYVNQDRVKNVGTPTAVGIANPLLPFTDTTGGHGPTDVSAARVQRMNDGRFALKVRLQTRKKALAARLKGSVRIQGAKHTLRLKTRVAGLAANRTRSVTLRLQRGSAKRRVLNALGDGKRVSARLRVKVVNAWGPVHVERLRIRVL